MYLGMYLHEISVKVNMANGQWANKNKLNTHVSSFLNENISLCKEEYFISIIICSKLDTHRQEKSKCPNQQQTICFMI